MLKIGRTLLSVILAMGLSRPALSEPQPDELLPDAARERLTQQEIVAGDLSLIELRRAGMTIFTRPFNHADGYGDGPPDMADPTTPGGRPTLQGNGSFLRVNGLDAQTCLECHSLVSMGTRPPIFGIGGAGAIASSALFMPRNIDVSDQLAMGRASIDGRLINPVSLFGAGGVQAVGREMTGDLQTLKTRALENPGLAVRLISKEVDFGVIVADKTGGLDNSGIEGIDDDLVVRPFGRKGEFATLRQFDQVAMMFHLGIQPVEIFGPGVDDDGDGVANEILVGEMSALEIFIATQDSPVQLRGDREIAAGSGLFETAGCVDCHRPMLTTESPYLGFDFPVVDDRPGANLYFKIDLRRNPARLRPAAKGGVEVPLFSDLKRHDMGAGLAEDFALLSEQANREFITAKLWGVADTAPYLHDGRALTLEEAIDLHGGEARAARDRFLALDQRQQKQVIVFLKSLRNPRNPNSDTLAN